LIGVGAVAVVLGTAGCQRLNPGFQDTDLGVADGATSTGDSGAMDETKGDGTGASGTTGPGDGDGDETGETGASGDGDGDSADDGDGTTGDGTTGDGDGTTGGDGDGDGSAQQCGEISLYLLDDTFYQRGGDEPDPGSGTVYCDAGTDIVPGACQETNFGATPNHWIGGEGDLRAHYAFHASPSVIASLPPGVTITGGTLNLDMDFEIAAWTGARIQVFPFLFGDGQSWHAGTQDAATPPAGYPDSTYKYRIWGTEQWPNWEPQAAAGLNAFGDHDVGGLVGLQLVEIPLDGPLLTEWFEAALSLGSDNGFLVTSDLEPYAASVASLEDTAALPPSVTVEYCLP
jgi:hypothetical protein